MFIGEFSHTVDAKGRVALPVKFRNELKKGLVVTKGLDTCLWIYTRSEWNELAKKLAALPISQSKNRSFVRLMLAGAMDVELDSQGRINMPKYLLDYAKLSKRAIVAGLYNRLEIWDEKEWDRYKKQMEKESTEIADSLNELSI